MGASSQKTAAVALDHELSRSLSLRSTGGSAVVHRAEMKSVVNELGWFGWVVVGVLATGCGASGGDDNVGLRERLDACGMAVNAQNGEVGNLSSCLTGRYVGVILFTSTPCSSELTEDGRVLFSVSGQSSSFERPFVYEGYTKKPRPVGNAGYSTTGYSIDWRADGATQSLVFDFNNDLHDGLQLRFAEGERLQTCSLTVR